ncbi:hypothetical protein PCE1_002848 [Barthelona sp. PCE]
MSTYALKSATFATSVLLVLLLAAVFVPPAMSSHPAKLLGDSDGDSDDATCFDPGNAPDPCDFIRHNCSNIQTGYVPLLEWRYCDFGFYFTPIFFIIAILVLFTLFFALGFVADRVLAPTLQYIARLLHMSPSLVSLSFVAWANGAPDLFSMYRSSVNGDFSLAVSDMLGSAIFIVSMVLAAITLVKPIYWPKKDFLRDFLSYCVALVWMSIVLLDGELKMWESAMSFGLYCVIIAYTYIQTRDPQRKKRDIEETLLKSANPSGIDLNFEASSDEEEETTGVVGFLLSSISFILLLFCPDHKRFNPKKNRENEFSWICLFVFIEPLLFLLFSVFYLDLVDNVVYVTFIDMEISYITCAVLIGVIVGPLFVAFYVYPHNAFYVVIRIINLLFAIMASDLLAGEVVNVLQGLGIILNVESSVMGIMCLSPANSIGDLVGDLAIAMRPGGALIALSATLLSPLVNGLLGLSVSLVPLNYPVHFQLNTSLIISLVFLVVILAIWLVGMLVNSCRTSKIVALTSVGTYILFCVTMLIFTLNK